MADDTLDLVQNYVLLEPNGSAITLPGAGEFWRQMMSGHATDPGIRQLMASENGRLLSVLSLAADWPNWEMHPAGDEILFMLEGKATFLLDLPQGVKEVDLGAGRSFVMPKGVWHTAKVSEPGRMLVITAGAGTQHRAA